jgi:hypothetical protein
MALMSVLTVIFVLVLVGALVLYLTGKEIAFVGMRLSGAQSLNIAEGGAVAARSALMALFNADPIRNPDTPDANGGPPLDATLTPSLLDTWYANGVRASQNALAILDYLTLDDESLTLNASASTASVTLAVNWSLATPRFKLEPAGGTPPANALGEGVYRAEVRVSRRLAPHPFLGSGQPCEPVPVDPTCRYIQRLGGAYYEYYYTYRIVSDGGVSPQFRRRVEFERDFSIRVRRQSFAEYALFTHVHMTPNTQTSGNQPIWFTSNTSFDGPVHTNGEFRFAFFPKFGTPDPDSPPNCGPYDAVTNPNGIRTTPLTSVSTWAWFNNRGSPRRLQANENVVSGTRRDAPVLPDCTPANTADDNDNPAANFTRGVAVIPMPTNIFSQQGVAIGRDPDDDSTVTNRQIRQAIPELANNDDAVPNGIYVPVQDANGNGISDAGEPLAGGIYVQGTLNSLTLSLGGPTNNLAVYRLVQGTQTVTVTVDRALERTTVTNTAWSDPQTRSFNGVPKGWQQPDPDFANAAIIFVNGNIQGLGGLGGLGSTLEEKEQTTIVASGRIDIANHIRYEVPPDPNDLNSNPKNLLGIYSGNNDIRITTAAPDNLVIHAVLMAGNPSDTYQSSVRVENYNSGSPRGAVTLLGGLIEEYYGAFGTFSSATGAQRTGYGRNFTYDRRMSRGFRPPYFPSITAFDLIAQGLAGARPTWREAAP